MRANGGYFIDSPQLTTPRDLLDRASEPSTLIGFDFPIGLPEKYALIAEVSSFPAALSAFGTGPWASFFAPAETRAEIAVGRPFYPHTPGGTSRRHIVEALGLSDTIDLYRACEIANGRRACPLFWTLGGNQVGKAALAGWKDFLQPAREVIGVGLWPFDGSLESLMARGRAVVVETYPGDVYRYVGATLPRVDGLRGKRHQPSRAASAVTLLNHLREERLEISKDLLEQIRDGFGTDRLGEDKFDAVIGVLGMLAVLRERRPQGAPTSPTVQTVEGWILGRSAAELSR